MGSPSSAATNILNSVTLCRAEEKDDIHGDQLQNEILQKFGSRTDPSDWSQRTVKKLRKELLPIFQHTIRAYIDPRHHVTNADGTVGVKRSIYTHLSDEFSLLPVGELSSTNKEEKWKELAGSGIVTVILINTHT